MFLIGINGFYGIFVAKSDTMQQKQLLNTFNFRMLPVEDNAIVYDGGLFLADTFSVPVGNALDYLQFKYPFKIDFAITIFCESGTMKVRMNLAEYEVGAGSCFISAPGSICEFLDVSADCRMFIIAMADSFFPADRISEHTSYLLKVINDHPLLSVGDEVFKELKELYFALYGKISDSGFLLKKEIAGDYISIMFCIVYQEMQKALPESQSVADKRLSQVFERFISLVQENCTAQREISFYADRLCLTPKYMSQLVLKTSGRYASHWIRDFVILEAKALLKSGKYTVQQVADKLNFSNASFFGKYFKAATGMTPRKYQYGK